VGGEEEEGGGAANLGHAAYGLTVVLPIAATGLGIPCGERGFEPRECCSLEVVGG